MVVGCLVAMLATVLILLWSLKMHVPPFSREETDDIDNTDDANDKDDTEDTAQCNTGPLPNGCL